MGAWVWRDEEGHLRCRRSPGGVEWYVKLQKGGGQFELWERLPAAGAEAEAPAADRSAGPSGGGSPTAGRVEVGRIDPETAEQIIKFLMRERRARQTGEE